MYGPNLNAQPPYAFAVGCDCLNYSQPVLEPQSRRLTAGDGCKAAALYVWSFPKSLADTLCSSDQHTDVCHDVHGAGSGQQLVAV